MFMYCRAQTRYSSTQSSKHWQLLEATSKMIGTYTDVEYSIYIVSGPVSHILGSILCTQLAYACLGRSDGRYPKWESRAPHTVPSLLVTPFFATLQTNNRALRTTTPLTPTFNINTLAGVQHSTHVFLVRVGNACACPNQRHSTEKRCLHSIPAASTSHHSQCLHSASASTRFSRRWNIKRSAPHSLCLRTIFPFNRFYLIYYG